MFNQSNPAATQRPEDVPLWLCFEWDNPEDNRTKIRKIYRKISLKIYFMENV